MGEEAAGKGTVVAVGGGGEEGRGGRGRRGGVGGGGGGGWAGGGGGGGEGQGSGRVGVGPEGATPGKWLTVSAMLRGAGGPAGTSTLAGVGPGGGSGAYTVEEEEVRSMLGLFAQLGKSRKDSEHRMDVPTFQSRLSAMPVRAQYTLQQALAVLAAHAPPAKPDKPMLLKLAEHVAIRFALDS